MAELVISSKQEWDETGLPTALHFLDSRERPAPKLTLRTAEGLAFLIGPQTIDSVRAPYIGEDYSVGALGPWLGATASGTLIRGRERDYDHALDLIVNPQTNLTAIITMDGLHGLQVATLEEISRLENVTWLTDEFMRQVDRHDSI